MAASAPPRMIAARSSGSPSAGWAATASANAGAAPIACRSLRALVAAIAPKVAGSSTIGVKKLTVATTARSSRTR